MPTLSLAMIVKNEADRLGRCLESVRELADELIVVDTGSTDGTPALARAHGAQVSGFEWCDDFAAARNASLQRCTGDWILVLDADERLQASSIPIVRQALFSVGSQGHLLTMRNHLPSGAYFGTHRAAQPDAQGIAEAENLAYTTELQALRLFRNHPGLRYSGRVHEGLEPAFESLGWKPTPLPAVIHHLGKAHPTRELAKQQAYFQMALQDSKERPESHLALYNLMQEAAMVKEWEVCADAALRFLQSAPRTAPLKVRLDGARALRELGQFAQAEALLREATPPPEAWPALLTARGELLAGQGKPEGAMELFLQAINLDPHYTEPFLCLSRLLQQGGDPASAKALLEAGLDRNPKDLLLWQALVGQAASAGDLQATAPSARDALSVFPQGGEGVWHGLLAAALIQDGRAQEASAVLTRGLSLFPGDPDLQALRNTLRGHPSIPLEHTPSDPVLHPEPGA